MKSVAEHLTAALAAVGPVRPLQVVLADAVGCILAEDVVATTNLPRADAASRDGYAVYSEDLASAAPDAPVTLPVVADAPIGTVDPMRLNPGGAIRIVSGAPVPVGADAVVPMEATDRGMAQVQIRDKAKPGENIRLLASDVAAGTVLVPAGTRIGARQVALVASSGLSRIVVHPRPRVVVVSIGDELVEPGKHAQAGQVFDSNGIALTSAVQDVGAAAFRVSAVPDERVVLRNTLEDQLVRADLIITTGGLSAGQGDTVKEVLGPLGTVRFDNVSMTPGRQFGLGVVGEAEIPIFALPGNPVDAFVAFEVFVRPALLKMAGWADLYRPAILATVTKGWSSPSGRRQFVRAQLTGDPMSGYTVAPVGEVDEPMLSSLAEANALAVIPEEVTEVVAGAKVHCMVLDA